MNHDVLSDVMSKIKNGDAIGRNYVDVTKSKLVRSVLDVMSKNDFVGKVEDNGSTFRVHLMGSVNVARSIRPRFAVSTDTYNKFKGRFLPASGVGIIIVSTSQGVFDHREAEEKKIGGRLIAFVY
jgi:small subunit ribosomal protein S8